MNTNAMDLAFNVAQTAADKDFKWWFLMLLTLMILSALWAFRYLLNKSERDRQAYEKQIELMHGSFERTINSLMTQNTESRERHAGRVESLQAQIFTHATNMIVAMTRNDKVIESATKAIESLHGNISMRQNV